MTMKTRFVIGAGVLGGVLAGFGSPPSDPPSGLDSRAAAVDTAKVPETKSAEVGTQKTGQGSDSRVNRTWNRSGPNYRASAAQSATADKSEETPQEWSTENSSEIPETIVKDLHSPDANTRYRALDYWGTQPDQPSLPPVFEAMEDEDPAVRRKAATIVEQHMELERENDQD